ncbi:MAG: hypothetical protein CMB16_00390 [Euryarchaeota archaeon]|nr:hypothetical protein [Euryarchaeota archaeon]|tara:strand:+ start:4052 stop:5065 length:1014 start_codon:yes stop_codon:yes gene_type:complete
MTVSTTLNKVSANGDGSTHIFNYTFKIFADTDLQVIVRSSTGVETTQQLNVNYVVTGANSDSGGTVLFKFNTGNTSDINYATADSRPPSGSTVTITRIVPLTQVTDYVANDPFPADAHETALDRLTFIVQQIQEELDRCIKASPTNTINSTAFTVGVSDRADRLFGFDAQGELTVSTQASDVANAQQNASNAAASNTSAGNHKDDAQKLATNAVDTQFTLTDGTTGFSALHYFTKSSQIATNLNLPTITNSDAGKFLRVNSGLTGYEFISPPSENAVFYGLKKDEAGTATYGKLRQDNSVVGGGGTYTLSDYTSYFFATAGVGFNVNASGHLTITTP